MSTIFDLHERALDDDRDLVWAVTLVSVPLRDEYHEHRRQIMLARSLGLTKTYNLFHDPACGDADIVRLREMHAEMDRAILASYGWEDVDLRHDFYPNDRGQMRYTVSPEARRELLRRLLEFNQKIAEGKWVFEDLRK